MALTMGDCQLPPDRHVPAKEHEGRLIRSVHQSSAHQQASHIFYEHARQPLIVPRTVGTVYPHRGCHACSKPMGLIFGGNRKRKKQALIALNAVVANPGKANCNFF